MCKQYIAFHFQTKTLFSQICLLCSSQFTLNSLLHSQSITKYNLLSATMAARLLKDPATVGSRIFIGHLQTDDMNRLELEGHFVKYGTIVGSMISRGFGFVQFEVDESAQAAINGANGSMFKGRRIDVRPAKKEIGNFGNSCTGVGSGIGGAGTAMGGGLLGPGGRGMSGDNFKTNQSNVTSAVNDSFVCERNQNYGGAKSFNNSNKSYGNERPFGKGDTQFGDCSQSRDSDDSFSGGQNRSNEFGEGPNRINNPNQPFGGGNQNRSFGGIQNSAITRNPNQNNQVGNQNQGSGGGVGGVNTSGGGNSRPRGNRGGKNRNKNRDMMSGIGIGGGVGGGMMSAMSGGMGGSIGSALGTVLGSNLGSGLGSNLGNSLSSGLGGSLGSGLGTGGLLGSGNNFRDRSPLRRIDEKPMLSQFREMNKSEINRLRSSGSNFTGSFNEMARNFDEFKGAGASHREMGPNFSGSSVPSDYPSIAAEKNDCEIIVVNKTLTEYAELIENKLKKMGLTVDLLFPNEDVPLSRVLGNIASRGCLYAIVIMPINKEHHSLTLNILHGLPQEHRNMPVEDAISLILRDFNNYKSGGRSVPLNAPLAKERHPDAIQVLLNMLADNHQLTVLQYERVIKYLEIRREEQVQVELGEDAQNIGTPLSDPKQAELQSRILNILNSSKTSSSTSETIAAVTASVVPSPVPPPSASTTAPTSSSTTSSTVTPSPLLNDPTVQKALDSLLQGNLLKNIGDQHSPTGATSAPLFAAFPNINRF